MPHRFLLITFSVGITITLAASSAMAASLAYTTAGATITQDFDTLPSAGSSNPWVNGTTLTGWHGFTSGAPSTTIVATNGQANQGRLLSEGTTGSSERALGTQSRDSGSAEMIGVQIANNTGSTLTDFLVTYDGEQWREVGVDIEDQFTVEYQIFSPGTGSLDAASGWNALAELTFDAPQTTGGSSTNLDGNNALNRVAGLTTLVSGLSWLEDDELWIRWIDQQANNRRQHLAVDNFAFSATAVPESASIAIWSFIGLGLIGYTYFRRKQRTPQCG